MVKTPENNVFWCLTAVLDGFREHGMTPVGLIFLITGTWENVFTDKSKLEKYPKVMVIMELRWHLNYIIAWYSNLENETKDATFPLLDRYIPNCINFSARTSANQTQDIVMSKLDR